MKVKRPAVFVAFYVLPWCAFFVWLFRFSPSATAEAQPAALTFRAQVAPLKTAVRQLKSGKWRITLETTDGHVAGLQRGREVVVSAR